jgi:MFS family permease
MAEEKPTAAFVLSLIGGIFILLFGIIFGILPFLFGAVIAAIPGLGGFGGIIIVLGLLGIIYGILVIIGAALIYTGDKGKVKIGGILVLLFSILSIFSPAFGGIIIGFILGLVGGILALVWKPEEVPKRPAIATPPPPS